MLTIDGVKGSPGAEISKKLSNNGFLFLIQRIVIILS